MNRPNRLEINGARLWSTLEASGQIGPGKAGGLSRLALDANDKVMRDTFVAWCNDAGLAVSVDGVGNIFARRAGTDESAAPVMIGSHLDTQVAGGRYDGILGVLSGLEIVRTLNDRGLETQRPIEIVCWSNEEGARFQPPMLASGAFAGVHAVDWVLDRQDDDGVRYGDALAEIGYDGPAPVGGRTIDAYFELHIEQGPILEREDVSLGIVTGGYPTHGMHVDVRGETAHSGPTPMEKRRNALIGASMLAVKVNEIGWAFAHEDGKASVPRMVVWPNKPGILPDYAQLSLDVRHPTDAGADAMLAAVLAAIPECADRAHVDFEIAQQWTFGAEIFDVDLITSIKQAVADQGVGCIEMLSQAGHDAYNMTRIAPTALVFTPCHDGITHNEGEHIEASYTVPGVNVLLATVVDRANR